MDATVKYTPELCAELSREVTEGLRNQLKQQFGADRYKFVVQCVMGELRGEGVRYVLFLLQVYLYLECESCDLCWHLDTDSMNARCFWDADTDCYAQDTFMNVRGAFCINMCAMCALRALCVQHVGRKSNPRSVS